MKTSSTINHSFSKYLSKSTVLLFSLFLLMVSCSKEEEYEQKEPVIQTVSGQAVNRLDNTPIPGLEMRLIYDLSFGNVKYIETYTDSGGLFFFHGNTGFLRPYITASDIFQSQGFWVNDEPFDQTGFWTEYKTDTPLEVKFGFYPKTFFKIHITNVAPSSENDSLKMTFENNSGSHFFNYTGILNDYTRQGATTFENILTINYDVVHNGITESFMEIIECIPGDTTDIFIEY